MFTFSDFMALLKDCADEPASGFDDFDELPEHDFISQEFDSVYTDR